MNRNSRSRRGQPHGPSGGYQGNRGRMMDDQRSGDGGGAAGVNNFQLRELDLELALLKRKRELMEQQQMMSNNSFGRQSAFDVPQSVPYNSREFDAPSRYTEYYDDVQEHRSFDRPRAPKRHPVDVWESDSAPKRAYQPPRSRSGAFTRLGPEPKSYNKPWADNSWQTKAKSGPPNRLNSYPVAQRKALIEHARDTVTVRPRGAEVEEDNVLHADKQASRSVLGRLEMALGLVLKEVKPALGQPYDKLDFEDQRAIKQEIRRRIRELMLGKHVGVAAMVYETYRARYPKSADKLLLNCKPADKKDNKANTTTTTRKPAAVKANEKEKSSPYDFYFKKNRDKLFREHLDKIFAQLAEIREKEKSALDKQIDEDINQIIQLEKQNNDAEVPVETPTETTTPADNSVQITSPDAIMADAPAEESTTEDNNEEIKAEANESQSNEKSEETAKTRDKVLNKSATENVKTDEHDEKTKAKLVIFDNLIGNFIRRKLSTVLPKYKEQILKILTKDEEFVSKETELPQMTRKALEEKSKPKTKTTESAEGDEKGVTFPRRFPYYAKVMGAPHLPKRNLMQNFLDQYNPASIRKHRYVHNLLFVGFKTKKDFDDILAADKTVIGKSTLNIKISDNIAKKPGEKSEPLSESTGGNNTKLGDNISMDSVDCKLDLDLDVQITDLLSAIREEEEKKNGEGKILEETPNDTGDIDTKIENGDELPTDKDTEGNEIQTDENGTKIENGDEIPTDKATESNEIQTDENGGDETESSQLEGGKEDQETEGEAQVENIKDVVKEEEVATPTRGSARLAGRVQTRRASKLAQN